MAKVQVVGGLGLSAGARASAGSFRSSPDGVMAFVFAPNVVSSVTMMVW